MSKWNIELTWFALGFILIKFFFDVVVESLYLRKKTKYSFNVDLNKTGKKERKKERKKSISR